MNGCFVGILIELLGELVATVIVKIGRVDIKDKLAIMGGIRLQAARGDGSIGFQLGEQVGVAGSGFLEMNVPFGAGGKNVGISIAVLFAFIVLLGVANGLVRNGEISDACAVNAIVSCQWASLLSGFREWLRGTKMHFFGSVITHYDTFIPAVCKV